MASPLCLVHRDAPVKAVCGRCGAGLCNGCWVFTIDGRPACAACVHDIEWRMPLHASRFAVFAAVVCGLGFSFARRVPDDAIETWIGVAIVVAIGLVITLRIAREKGNRAAAIERRDPEVEAPDSLARPAHPYRTRVARAVGAQPTALSATGTTVVLAVVLVLSGILVPASLHLPRWIEAEIVLGVWWGILGGLLTTLLYRGTRLREDHAFRVRWNLPARGAWGSTSGPSSPSTASSASWLDGATGCADLEGCGGVLVGLAFALIAIAASWFVVDLAFPVVFFVLYRIVVNAIANVANDRHACRGSLGRALGWGSIWATLYTLPVAAIVSVAHLALAARAR